jgi:hypothetical protein
MRTPVLISIAATMLLAMAASASFAQTPGSDGEKGSTGWSGGSKDQSQTGPGTSGQAVVVHDEAKAKEQPPIATGKDLKGPPAQLAPSKTPE